MPRSIFATRPRRKTLLDRYLAEPIMYGGELLARGDVIRDLKRCGLDNRCIDRFLQGSELADRLRTARLFCEPPTRLIQ